MSCCFSIGRSWSWRRILRRASANEDFSSVISSSWACRRTSIMDALSGNSALLSADTSSTKEDGVSSMRLWEAGLTVGSNETEKLNWLVTNTILLLEEGLHLYSLTGSLLMAVTKWILNCIDTVYRSSEGLKTYAIPRQWSQTYCWSNKEVFQSKWPRQSPDLNPAEPFLSWRQNLSWVAWDKTGSTTGLTEHHQITYPGSGDVNESDVKQPLYARTTFIYISMLCPKHYSALKWRDNIKTLLFYK